MIAPFSTEHDVLHEFSGVASDEIGKLIKSVKASINRFLICGVLPKFLEANCCNVFVNSRLQVSSHINMFRVFSQTHTFVDLLVRSAVVLC